VIAECSANARAALNGTLTEYLSRAHGRHKARTKIFRLATVHASLKAGSSMVLAIELPAAAVRALREGKRESATLTLAALSGGATAHASTTFKSLRL
jgi:hypothetical protein